MISAFQSSGFQNNAFQIQAASPPPVASGGGGGGTTGYRLLSNGAYGELHGPQARKKRRQREYDDALAVLLLLS